MKRGKRGRVAGGILLGLLFLSAAVVLLNALVKSTGTERMLSEGDAPPEGVDCILVLGCGVKPDGTPSDMLRDRLDTAIGLYERGASDRMLMSGDNGSADYNEVGVMKAYAVARGVPSQAVFQDHAGFSTYDSLYRAGAVFGAKRVVVVTQRYHLYRALYLADRLGLDAWGRDADRHVYGGQSVREVREVFARGKDFFAALAKPQPKYLGDPIPLAGSGDAT